MLGQNQQNLEKQKGNDLLPIDKITKQNKMMSMKDVLKFKSKLNLIQVHAEEMSFEVASSLHAVQSQSHQKQGNDAMESARSQFKSEGDMDEVASYLQSSHSMSSDEDQEEQEKMLMPGDLIAQLMDESDEDGSDESFGCESQGSGTKTAVSGSSTAN